MGDRLFILAELECGGVRDTIDRAMQDVANEARRILALPVGPLSPLLIDLLAEVCRDCLSKAYPVDFERTGGG